MAPIRLLEHWGCWNVRPTLPVSWTLSLASFISIWDRSACLQQYFWHYTLGGIWKPDNVSYVSILQIHCRNVIIPCHFSHFILIFGSPRFPEYLRQRKRYGWCVHFADHAQSIVVNKNWYLSFMPAILPKVIRLRKILSLWSSNSNLLGSHQVSHSFISMPNDPRRTHLPQPPIAFMPCKHWRLCS